MIIITTQLHGTAFFCIGTQEGCVAQEVPGTARSLTRIAAFFVNNKYSERPLRGTYALSAPKSETR